MANHKLNANDNTIVVSDTFPVSWLAKGEVESNVLAVA